MMIINRTYRVFFWIVTFGCLLFGAAQILTTSASEDSNGLIINEFLAANGTGLSDEDGDYSDWIEIYNRSNQAVNLSSWSLTDDPDQPEKWTFPEVSLPGQEYLVVFASGKDRKPGRPGSTLHTNFKLRQKGEFLALYSILDSRLLDVASPQFPEQFRDVAYGRYGDQLAYGYLATPTPGQPNAETLRWLGVVSGVEYSHQRGFYEEPFLLELTTATPGATIRYTTDGSEPTESTGLIYSEPIRVAAAMFVRAVAFKPNFLPSYMDTHTYIFLNDVLVQPADPPGFPSTWGIHSRDYENYRKGSPVMADYEMDPEVVNDPAYQQTIEDDLRSIPTMSIVADQRSFYIYANPREKGRAWERPASIELIEPDGNKKGFQINAGVRIQGGEGRYEYVPKHSFRLFFRGEYGPTKLDYPLFPGSPVDKFDTIVLRGGVSSSYAGISLIPHKLTTYTRDEWLRSSQIAMSGVGSHGIFVHLYLNGLYWGLYNVVERPDEAFVASYFGGRKEDWYVINQGGPVSGSGVRFDTLHQLASNGNLDDPAKYAEIKTYLDTAHFVDYVILNWYAGNRDWPDQNWYADVQNPSGQVRYFVWDGEYIWVDGARVHLGDRSGSGFKPLFKALMQNPDFKMELADRMYKHLFNNGALTDANSRARWIRINDAIDRAIVGESARWGDVRFDRPITRVDWLNARDEVLAQMEGNAARLIAQAREAGYYPDLDPPRFNRRGGLVAAGFELVLTRPDSGETGRDGTIYYTTGGSDPRAQVTGAVAPSAVAYSAPVVLTTATQIKARVLAGHPSTVRSLPAGLPAGAGQAHSLNSGQAWSALDEATFRVAERDSKLRITEIMYNPTGGGDYEFIELKNTGHSELDLAGASFAGIDFTFPASTTPLAPGEFIVLARNPSSFAQRYPDVTIGGSYQGQLSNTGETITLVDREGREVASVTYDDENNWPVSPDGWGDSLALIDQDRDPNDPKSWRASTHLNGSPGANDPLP